MSSVLHMPMRSAIKQIIQLCIENGDDDEFVDAMVDAKGMEVFCRTVLWKMTDQLTRDGANGNPFPEGSPDAEAFMAVYDIEGHTSARAWLRRRIRAYKPTGGGQNHDRAIQRITYYPVNSKLDATRQRAPKNRAPERAALMEEAP